jgi:alkanesulfonate monooxygenase SsuD/methylene tetrahydromethanopterin reductase-like flavin-dependent oxidoreductase (luciferase family)
MEFALVLGPFLPPRNEMPSKDAFDLQMAFCERAAACGFDGVSMGHHYLSGPFAQFFQPIPLAGHIFAKHPELFVATTIFLLPYHSPVEVAEDVATLDAMAPGRLVLGVGQGYREDEARGAGIDPASRRERLAESIAAMRLLWRDGTSSFEGVHFSFRDGDIGPRPMDPNGPPIVIGADTPANIARIPSIGGDHWIVSPRNTLSFVRRVLPDYKRALSEAGREFAGLPMMRTAYITDDEAEAQSTLERVFKNMAQIQSRWGQPGERSTLSFEQIKEERILLGSPEQVAERLIALHRELGVQCVFLHVYTPGMDPAAALAMVDRLGTETLPLVREAVGETSLFWGSDGSSGELRR